MGIKCMRVSYSLCVCACVCVQECADMCTHAIGVRVCLPGFGDCWWIWSSSYIRIVFLSSSWCSVQTKMFATLSPKLERVGVKYIRFTQRIMRWKQLLTTFWENNQDRGYFSSQNTTLWDRGIVKPLKAVVWERALLFICKSTGLNCDLCANASYFQEDFNSMRDFLKVISDIQMPIWWPWVGCLPQ